MAAVQGCANTLGLACFDNEKKSLGFSGRSLAISKWAQQLTSSSLGGGPQRCLFYGSGEALPSGRCQHPALDPWVRRRGEPGSEAGRAIGPDSRLKDGILGDSHFTRFPPKKENAKVDLSVRATPGQLASPGLRTKWACLNPPFPGP